MKVTVWGARGSQASPGPDTAEYGGNTSCLQVETVPGHLLVLDAGTGIRPLGQAAPADVSRVDVLLSHLHMDHIQGLGFFGLLYRPGLEVHVWGPASATMDLRERLSRYLSPPLFPVRLRDLDCDLRIETVPFEPFELPGVTVSADLVCHPGPTVGYRLETPAGVVAYLPDHEPELCGGTFTHDPEWTSGTALAAGADLLFHDAQYTHDEYAIRIGWGHSTGAAALAFAELAGARHLVLTHHDPTHDDAHLAAWHGRLAEEAPDGLRVSSAREGDVFEV